MLSLLLNSIPSRPSDVPGAVVAFDWSSFWLPFRQYAQRPAQMGYVRKKKEHPDQYNLVQAVSVAAVITIPWSCVVQNADDKW
jgi:hypothetical protein